jgi:hypothetical protein
MSVGLFSSCPKRTARHPWRHQEIRRHPTEYAIIIIHDFRICIFSPRVSALAGVFLSQQFLADGCLHIPEYLSPGRFASWGYRYVRTGRILRSLEPT